MPTKDKVARFIDSVKEQFYYRAIYELKKSYGITSTLELKVEQTDNIILLTFLSGSETHIIEIPTPFNRDGLCLIENNDVTRAVCPFWLEQDQMEIDYMAVVHIIMFGNPANIINETLVKKVPFIQQIVYGFKNNNASIVVYKLQKAINEIINMMPLHETNMNSYVMNNRLIIIDSNFDTITSPEEKLNYQVSKANKYFDKAFTPLGLSDSAMADKNYILKVDLRKLSPFGINFHNPQRNLYSTLSMKGDELPNIRTESMQRLLEKGITRKGWHLFTAFVDIPDVFEDQIMVDRSHLNKYITYKCKQPIFGKVFVKPGEVIKRNTIIGSNLRGESKRFGIHCDHAEVTTIKETFTVVGGATHKLFNVFITYKRKLRDGVKLTNMHGNKGIIRIADLGTAIDPRTGTERKIDVIVAGKTIGNRKNYGQVMEALSACILEADEKTDPIIINDSWYQPMDEVLEGLVKRGFNKDGTWECKTYCGTVRAVCGNLFWGVIKTPEDQLWDNKDTFAKDEKGLRRAGLKFSHVEFRALETRFGENNPITEEITSYSQGTVNTRELLRMIDSKRGIPQAGKPIVNIDKVIPLDQTDGTIVHKDASLFTVVDENFYPDGFVLKLPAKYQTVLETSGIVFHEGAPLEFDKLSEENKNKIGDVYTTEYLYFPTSVLRKCWQHDNGKIGLNEVGTIINAVVIMSHKLAKTPDDPLSYRLYYNSINSYFNKLASFVGTKKGNIATYTMAIRYPFSVKATATLSNKLPKNTVEIHKDMANQLMVKTGDIVIVERFPCLGFMSIRPQKVRVTNDPMCRYTIRASGNSLVSENLDFDGDVLYLASFHSKEAKAILKKEWTNPNKTCYSEIQKLNNRKGNPSIKEYSLNDFCVSKWPELTKDMHESIVRKNVGVKMQTGPVVALTYNIMRIVENSDLAKSNKMKVAVEMFLEKTAQSVFEQKHGGESLYNLVVEYICKADVDGLVKVGFSRGTTEKLCQLIVERASKYGIKNLSEHYGKTKERNSSNIINFIVRKENKIYFASRSKLEGITLLKILINQSNIVDIPSKMFNRTLTTNPEVNSKTFLDSIIIDRKIKFINDKELRALARQLCEEFDRGLVKEIMYKKME